MPQVIALVGVVGQSKAERALLLAETAKAETLIVKDELKEIQGKLKASRSELLRLLQAKKSLEYR